MPGKPEMVNTVLGAGIAALVATLIIGILFTRRYGFGIVPLGLIGVILIIVYTKWISKHPLFCLIAPGMGLGFGVVVGTQYVLEGQYALLSWLVAVVPFFLVNNLLLLNQYPDVEADSQVGRNHFPIAYGIRRSNVIYGFFVLAATAAIATSVSIGYLPTLSLIAILPLPLALFSLRGAIKHGEDIGQHPRYLATNAAMAIVTPLLLGMSLMFG